MKLTLGFLCVVSIAHSYPFDLEWSMFKAEHGKIYKNAQEENFRMNIFLDNNRKIEQHNRDFENGKVTYKLKMNKFGDMLSHEFKALMNRLKNETVPQKSLFVPANGKLPESVDWRKKGAVTPVKDQGHCGSCWAFSATGALEGQLFLKKGKLVSLSEQNLVDCDESDDGCRGGLPYKAFEYIQKNGGIDTEKSYPYEGVDSECRFKPSNVGGSDSGFVFIKSGSEEALKEAVATIGPISVSIDASQDTFHLYSSGVYFDINCSPEDLDHAVLVVGYGSENGQDYWLVKNSWNSDWGENGYIKMARNKNNNCGIATSANYPVV